MQDYLRRSFVGINLACAAVVGLSATQDADAALILSFEQVGDDVVLTTSGTLDFSGLALVVSGAEQGATNALQPRTGHLILGSGSNADVDYYVLTVQNNALPANGGDETSNPTFAGTVDTWSSNSNSVRFQQNNGRVLVSESLATTTLTLNSTHTFADVTLADFELEVGDNILWLENESAGIAGDDGKVFVTAVPEPGSLALLGLGALCLIKRRWKA